MSPRGNTVGSGVHFGGSFWGTFRGPFPLGTFLVFPPLRSAHWAPPPRAVAYTHSHNNLKPLEIFVKLEFIPSHRRSKPRQLPLPIHLSVKVLHHRVSVPFVLDRPPIERGVPLVRGAQLVVADGFVIRHFAPLGRADMVLRVHKGVADEPNVRHDPYKLFRRHGRPHVPVHLRVVDLKDFRSVSEFARLLDVYGIDWMDKKGGRTIRVGASMARSLTQSLSS